MMGEGSRVVIQAEKLAKTYSDNGVPVPAVRGIDLTIHAGEFTAIVGPSGSGKTTLLHLLSGLDTPTAGEVWLNGKALARMSGRELSDFRRDHIGFIFQAYNLIPVLTVEENVEYVMLLQKVPKRERRGRVLRILQEVGLADLAHRLPPQLSGGQQQRVAIARAMVAKPSLILADEPTANLDSSTGAGLLDMMHRLNERTGMTFVFSTHDEMIMKRARRVITIKDGLIAGEERRDG
ncbi:MAG: ABC transporter ATP-binding protein [candidate division KSB1 bacterium]|nr:ABC transporter ATP-binding protein [candidate division KSB1 bacterium]MDZ7274254.1 ABC transporter ATP-binding protein [candidate division KSB1 bacterium]MDZ7287224.1 ABC transporter ATP-binding protein [candidate division KSB1 bacterium]MDZ7296852.1 ABC transporter ATP-binding protein [candidate division KSB1 bacterium]MDZ7306044.1 ABC transporter ATP-binding protein [candidate division KSB1 bacterium]